VDHRRIIGRHEIGQHLRATGRRPAFGAENVLLGDRDTGQRTGRTGGDADIGVAGHFQALFAVKRDEGVEGRIQALDAVKEQRAQFDAGNLPGGQGLRQFLQALVDHSITFGTRYNPASVSGATA
jgi:hypothetical protein